MPKKSVKQEEPEDGERVIGVRFGAELLGEIDAELADFLREHRGMKANRSDIIRTLAAEALQARRERRPRS